MTEANSTLDEKIIQLIEKHRQVAKDNNTSFDSVVDDFLQGIFDLPELEVELEPLTIPEISVNDELQLGFLLAQKLAADLDAGRTDTIDPIGYLLNDLPAEVSLAVCRSQIQIERMVKHNLDEHPTFVKVLTKQNDDVEAGLEPQYDTQTNMKWPLRNDLTTTK